MSMFDSIPITTDYKNVYVSVGNNHYSKDQCDALYKQLTEGNILQQSEIEAVLLAKLGHLFEEKPPYTNLNPSLILVRDLLLNLGVRISNLISKANKAQRDLQKLQERAEDW